MKEVRWSFGPVYLSVEFAIVFQKSRTAPTAPRVSPVAGSNDASALFYYVTFWATFPPPYVPLANEMGSPQT